MSIFSDAAKYHREKKCTKALYASRKSGETAPEGEFDSFRRWGPSDREDCEGDGRCGSPPSKTYPYSYLNRCRTKQHCRLLVRRAIEGKDVPPDVRDILLIHP